MPEGTPLLSCLQAFSVLTGLHFQIGGPRISALFPFGSSVLSWSLERLRGRERCESLLKHNFLLILGCFPECGAWTHGCNLSCASCRISQGRQPLLITFRTRSRVTCSRFRQSAVAEVLTTRGVPEPKAILRSGESNLASLIRL